MKRLLNHVRNEVTYFLEKNEADIWAVLFLVWLGFVINN